MLRPSMSQILKPGESYYEFVVAVAQKAREIADQAIKDKICLEDKSVTLAVQMFASGEQKLSDLKMHIGRQGEAEEQGDAPEAEPSPEEPEEDDDLEDPEEDELA